MPIGAKKDETNYLRRVLAGRSVYCVAGGRVVAGHAQNVVPFFCVKNGPVNRIARETKMGRQPAKRPSSNPATIAADCCNVREGLLDPNDFDSAMCVECESRTCKWHPDKLGPCRDADNEDADEDADEEVAPGDDLDDGNGNSKNEASVAEVAAFWLGVGIVVLAIYFWLMAVTQFGRSGIRTEFFAGLIKDGMTCEMADTISLAHWSDVSRIALALGTTLAAIGVLRYAKNPP